MRRSIACVVAVLLVLAIATAWLISTNLCKPKQTVYGPLTRSGNMTNKKPEDIIIILEETQYIFYSEYKSYYINNYAPNIREYSKVPIPNDLKIDTASTSQVGWKEAIDYKCPRYVPSTTCIAAIVAVDIVCCIVLVVLFVKCIIKIYRHRNNKCTRCGYALLAGGLRITQCPECGFSDL
mgnify:CR=1 FL=1